jgi:hypothetical protein
MGRRYTDIRRGGELKTALENKTAYDLNTKGARTTKRLTGGTGTTRPTEKVGIYPFTRKTGETPVLYLVRIQKASLDATATVGYDEFAKYYDKTPTAAKKLFESPPSGFSAARATISVLKNPEATTFQYKQAKATKLYYPNKESTRRHYPIGRLNTAPDTADEVEVKRALLSTLATNLGNGVTLTFKDEKAGGLT